MRVLQCGANSMCAIEPYRRIRIVRLAVFSLILRLALGHANPYKASDIVVQTFGRGLGIFEFQGARAGDFTFLQAPGIGLRR